MKALFSVACAALIIGITVAAFAASAEGHRDWRRDIATSGNDIATFLRYNPTDGASYAGKVRQAMRPSQVNP